MHRKLSFTTAEGPIYWRTHCIMELCDYLTANVLEPMFIRDGAKWNRRVMDFFTFDYGCDPLEPIGTIRFSVPPLFAGRVTELETAITQELAKLRIKIGPFHYERDPALQTVQTILISITENPTALAAPPDVNMSHTRGCVVLRDLLGYQRVNGRYEFTADDLAGGALRMAIASGLYSSNGDALRAISQGGLSINDERLKEPDDAVPAPLSGRYLVLRAGKKSVRIGRLKS